MKGFNEIRGIDWRPVKTQEAPGVAKTCYEANSQFGVEKNQLNDDTVPDLATKAQLDLLNKVSAQKYG